MAAAATTLGALVAPFTTLGANASNATNSSCALAIVPEGEDFLFDILSYVFVFVSSLSTTFGLFWQKAAQEYFSQAKHEFNAHKSRVLKCRGTSLWVLGFLCITILSFGLDLFALSVLGQSVVVPLLASLEIAENQIFAPCMVKEVCVKKYDITATVFIVVGAVLTSYFGPQGSEVCSIEAIQDLFSKVPFIVFEGIILAIMILCLALMWSKAKCVDSFRFMLFAFVAGTLGGEQNLFLKGIGVLIGFAFNGEDTFGEWQIWVFLLAMVTLAVLQLVILNMGLAKFEALQFIPAFTVLYILQGTMVGLIFYEEYKGMTTLKWGMFLVGIAFIVSALVILSQKKSVETGAHTAGVDENGNPVLVRQKSFSPMLVSGAALEHLKHLARPLHNRIMLLRAFRRAHSMTSISHSSVKTEKVAPLATIVEMAPLHRHNKHRVQPQRSFSVDHSQGSAENDVEEIAAAKGHVATAKKKKKLESVFSNASTGELRSGRSSDEGEGSQSEASEDSKRQGSGAIESKTDRAKLQAQPASNPNSAAHGARSHRDGRAVAAETKESKSQNTSSRSKQSRLAGEKKVPQ